VRNARVDRLEAALQRLAESQAQTQDALRALATAQQKTEEHLARLTARVDRLAEQVQHLTARLDQFAARVDQLAEQVQHLTVRLDQFTARVDQLTARVDHLTARVDQLTARVDQLAEQVQHLTVRLDQLTARVDQLAVRFDELAMRVDQLTARVDQLTEQVRRLTVVVGTLQDESLERRYRERAPAYFDDLLRGLHTLTWEELAALLDDAQTRGLITRNERRSLLEADLVARGRRWSDDSTVYLVAEVSAVIDSDDVRRAVDRAGLLARATHTPTLAAVAGETITASAEETARALRVWQVLDGRATPPESPPA
jgi:chromosome segregation ATPase